MWMNSRQKEILQSQLNDEEAVLKKLKGVYKKALDDVDDRISALMGRTDTENLQSIIYQVQYQKALKTQINGILDTLNGEQFDTIADYISKSYESGFTGVMYDLHGQGLPFIFPIDQNQVVRAIQHDTKLSKSLYDSLGENISVLKKRIQNDISRGIAQGSSYADIAKNVASGMVGDYSKMRGGALGKAMQIARTESHRITNEATYDAQLKAKENGADIVKQWDATIDKRTRPHHAQLDGQIREIDEKFEVSGRKALYPGGFGIASEDVNCRCAVLQRAKWALDEDELQTLKDRAEYFKLDKTENFEDFKKKYLDASKNVIYNGKVEQSSGAISGAYNNINDPEGKKREDHAVAFYDELRNSEKGYIIDAISKNSGIDSEQVSKMYDHLLINEYPLDKGKSRFDPDYYIAESLQRLREGKNIQEHDLIMIRHEALEYDLMNGAMLDYEEAHAIANKSFNYKKALDKWLKATEKGG